MRKQYHFQKSNAGYSAWDVDKLISKSKDFPIIEVSLDNIKEINENFWYQDKNNTPTIISILNHIELIESCDLKFPIILSDSGRVMDGMHRVCKAYLNNQKLIKAVKFPSTPKPDFENVTPEELPY